SSLHIEPPHTDIYRLSLHDALPILASQGIEIKLACCVYATAPFVTPNDISAGLEKFESGDYEYVVSVTSFEFPIQRACRITSGRSEEHTSELQSRENLVCRLLLEKK